MKNTPKYTPKYRLTPEGEFIIEDYNYSKPFANFFPGIAGRYGIPMWVFYVNRGQAIVSMGTRDKDHSIMEFIPANRAWQIVTLRGFRTFIKLNKGANRIFYEPFHNGFTSLNFKLSNKMSVTSYDLRLNEKNLTLGLETGVEYFNIPNEPYAGLVRAVTLRNTGKTAKNIQVLDGLPEIVPFGTSNLFLKKLGRTIEAWMNVTNIENKAPFYKLEVDPTDRPEIIHIKEGNFYLSFYNQDSKPVFVKPIVDPESVFGPVKDFSCPLNFLNAKKIQPPPNQSPKSKTPCGFTPLDLHLKPGEEFRFCSLIGSMRDIAALNSSLAKISSAGYIAGKSSENKSLIRALQENVDTHSGSLEFDLYAKQTYLDNVIRGGYPLVFKTESGNSAFYLYSRKHGDLERDYNKFQIQPTYFSQGNGNYRDINQNRRCDVWFNPAIGDENIVIFLNLIQADGFNPLVVKGAAYHVESLSKLKEALNSRISDDDFLRLQQRLSKSYTPGEILIFIEENGINLDMQHDEFLNMLISYSVREQEAEHGEGFWTDHWSYNLDLIESYLAFYPENMHELIFNKKVFTFFDNYEVVRPRREKHLLYNGHPRQLQSVYADPEKKEMIKSRSFMPHAVRTGYGKGDIYKTTLFNKLLCLLANKLASLDPFGVGIEMEANKPNWFDALNGLPALFGSSSCETFELKRLILFLKGVLDKSGLKKLFIAEEIKDLLFSLGGLLSGASNMDDDTASFEYWDKSYSLKEGYREKTKFGFSGNEAEASKDDLMVILDAALAKVEAGISKAFDTKKKLYYGYFMHEVAQYDTLDNNRIRVRKFIQKRLPLFLEAQVHALRLTGELTRAKAIHKSTKASGLYDRKLGMYKVTESLAGMPEEIGRCRAFTPGWLENESIWLHMEYKYLLELLKSGLYEDFYLEFKRTLIPFQKPQDYGRNILENSSFLVGSSFPDARLHGNGFVARLSGSTAEFLEMWLVMNVGKKPFFLNPKNELNLKFSPVLSGWLFDKRGIYSFNFLGHTRITYHNQNKKNTFGKGQANIRRIVFKDKDNLPVEIQTDTIPHPYAADLRARLISAIDIFMA